MKILAVLRWCAHAYQEWIFWGNMPFDVIQAAVLRVYKQTRTNRKNSKHPLESYKNLIYGIYINYTSQEHLMECTKTFLEKSSGS